MIERRRYSKISRRIWGDEGFNRLSKPKPNAQTLFFRLMIPTEGLSMPGLIPVGEASLAEALGWSVPALRKCFAEIEREGMAKADWRARVIWLPNAVHHNSPESPNVVASWRVGFDEIPECALKAEAGAYIESFLSESPRRYDEAFLKAWKTGKRDPSRKPKTEAIAKPLPEPLANKSNNKSNSNNSVPHTPPVPPARPVTLMSGRTSLDWHKEHGPHAFCGEQGRLCVPKFLHGEMVRNRGGDSDEADGWLKARYAAWDAELARTNTSIRDATRYVRERYAKEVEAPARTASHLPEWFQCDTCGGAHQGHRGDPCPNKQAVVR